MKAKKIKFVVSISVIVAVLIWLTISSFNENMQYFITVEEVQAMSHDELNQGLRIKGFLAPGSIEETPNSLEVFFVLEEGAANMRVRFDKERPDTFKDGSEVLVEGRFASEGYFEAKTLMAKCPSKYETDEDYNLANYDPSKHIDNAEGTF